MAPMLHRGHPPSSSHRRHRVWGTVPQTPAAAATTAPLLVLASPSSQPRQPARHHVSAKLPVTSY